MRRPASKNRGNGRRQPVAVEGESSLHRCGTVRLSSEGNSACSLCILFVMRCRTCPSVIAACDLQHPLGVGKPHWEKRFFDEYNRHTEIT